MKVVAFVTKKREGSECKSGPTTKKLTGYFDILGGFRNEAFCYTKLSNLFVRILFW